MSFWPGVNWPSDRFSIVADIATILGLIASVIAAVNAARAGKAVRQLEEKYARRDLLPEIARQYQRLYDDLQLLLSRSPNARDANVKLSELEGILNSLESYLTQSERRVLRQIKQHLELIKKQPNSPDHYEKLLGLTAMFSMELDHIRIRDQWNSQL